MILLLFDGTYETNAHVISYINLSYWADFAVCVKKKRKYIVHMINIGSLQFKLTFFHIREQTYIFGLFTSSLKSIMEYRRSLNAELIQRNKNLLSVFFCFYYSATTTTKCSKGENWIKWNFWNFIFFLSTWKYF